MIRRSLAILALSSTVLGACAYTPGQSSRYGAEWPAGVPSDCLPVQHGVAVPCAPLPQYIPAPQFVPAPMPPAQYEVQTVCCVGEPAPPPPPPVVHYDPPPPPPAPQPTPAPIPEPPAPPVYVPAPPPPPLPVQPPQSYPEPDIYVPPAPVLRK